MAISEELRKQYKPTIGIECHVQLKTKTKLFSGAGNDARDAKPNTLISHIDTAMPGALPVLNEKALELACLAAFALNTQPQKHSYFERKHYFYPDSPSGYQISQLNAPIIVGGSVEINIDGQAKTIRINRAQLEADAGKNTHPAGADYSLVDLNRAGTPLLEIVSEPDINSPAEAKAYARELYLLMKYADVSDVDLYHGNMRFDVNISVSPADKLGTRAEVKNLNSFRSVENAVQFEIDRQIDLLESGEKVVQETRGWNDEKQKTISQRTKEEDHDYRYMPEPDIPPIELDDDFINKISEEMPKKMPKYWREILNDLEVDKASIELLLDAEVENPKVSHLLFIEERLPDKAKAKREVNLIVNVIIPIIREKGVELLQSSEWTLIFLGTDTLVENNKLNSTNLKTLIMELLDMDELPEDVEAYAEERGLIQVSDEGEIEKIVANVIKENPKAAEDVKNGEAKAIGFLVGQVMAKSKGQANPQVAQKAIRKQLGI